MRNLRARKPASLEIAALQDAAVNVKRAKPYAVADYHADSAQGLDENAQKALVTKAALAFNELLPVIPIYERYGNNPTAEGVRVTGWPADTDPIFKNSPYADSFVIMLMYEGKLQGKAAAAGY